MTFEEWKEKHNDLIENVAITFFDYGKGVDTKTCYDELEYLLKRAFKAGRPKWHKVADGDLPKDDIKLAIIEIDDCGYLLCNYRNGFWYDANSGATCAEWITNNIIAWKEIVLPELKESE